MKWDNAGLLYMGLPENQEEKCYVKSRQTYGGRHVVDESQVMWTEDNGHWYH